MLSDKNGIEGKSIPDVLIFRCGILIYVLTSSSPLPLGNVSKFPLHSFIHGLPSPTSNKEG